MEIEVADTRSSDVAPSTVVVLAEGTNLESVVVVPGARKMLGGVDRVGRRVGSEEKDLSRISKGYTHMYRNQG